MITKTLSNPFLNNQKCALVLGVVLSIAIFSHATAATSNPSVLPRGCHNEGYSFHHKALTLLPSKAGNNDSVYFVYNNSGSTINLYQLKSANAHMGLNINNKIRAYSWGVYSSDEDLVRFACSIENSDYDHGQLVDCQERLDVCEYTHVKYGLNNRGNYWMSRSNTRGGALRRVNRLGVLLTNE
tara:strand:+ start:196 stop:747 length:552 start_codon:yes stop_codon:yes gene_type:complete